MAKLTDIFCVYKHTSPSGKAYIGMTNNYNKRCAAHQGATNKCLLFAKAIRKYGWDNFKHEILFDMLTIDEALSLEILLIDEHNTLNPMGYNLTKGGEGMRPSEETRLKMSSWQVGKKHSEETKAKLSEKAKGRKRSPETHAKIVSKQLGSKRSDETKAKMSAASLRQDPASRLAGVIKRTGRKNTDEMKAIISAKNTGKKRTQEQKDNTSRAGKAAWDRKRMLAAETQIEVVH
jgi:group I intron endonuclease